MKSMKIFTGEDNTTLRKVSDPVTNIDDEVRELEEKMRITMKKEKGIGLAAPQVGVNKRIILATLGDTAYYMINPKIVRFSTECSSGEEGCLSLPDVFDRVVRPKRVTLEYTDVDEDTYEVELSDLDARVVQHEIDHLNGVLFTDRVEKKDTVFQENTHIL